MPALSWKVDKIYKKLYRRNVYYIQQNWRREEVGRHSWTKILKKRERKKYDELCINDLTHLGGGETCQKVTLFHKPIYTKMGDKGEGGDLKQWVTSFMDSPWGYEQHRFVYGIYKRFLS